jgi:hypothetical protein
VGRGVKVTPFLLRLFFLATKLAVGALKRTDAMRKSSCIFYPIIAA